MLPEDMTRGSRELLLAFSYLLQKENIFDNVLKRELAVSEISKDYNLNLYNNKNFNITVPNLCTVEEFYNYILWISGKINNNLKQISEYKMKVQQLANKVILFYKFYFYLSNELFIQVHKDTNHTKHVSHLSINETSLLKNHDHLKNYLHKIQKITQMLDYYNRWKSKESFYWEWMVSIVSITLIYYKFQLIRQQHKFNLESR